MKNMIFILCSISMMLVSTNAIADITTSEEEEGYGYEFDDDPLNAGGFGPTDATIKVRPMAARVTLIRPRTSFVIELIRSVEDL